MAVHGWRPATALRVMDYYFFSLSPTAVDVFSLSTYNMKRYAPLQL